MGKVIYCFYCNNNEVVSMDASFKGIDYLADKVILSDIFPAH